jgi:hypothetical protein
MILNWCWRGGALMMRECPKSERRKEETRHCSSVESNLKGTVGSQELYWSGRRSNCCSVIGGLGSLGLTVVFGSSFPQLASQFLDLSAFTTHSFSIQITSKLIPHPKLHRTLIRDVTRLFHLTSNSLPTTLLLLLLLLSLLLSTTLFIWTANGFYPISHNTKIHIL